MKYGLIGDREISVKILEFLMNEGYKPSFIFINESNTASHADELIQTSQLDRLNIFSNKDLKDATYLQKIKKYDVDYIFGIHYPFIICKEFLNIPKVGFLNLHPAFLPFNKGWHTPSWAIYDNTKYGATLHFMSEELDEGDIILQKEIEILQDDTANSLYKKVLALEFITFKEALPKLISLKPNRIKQKNTGTSHKKNDLENIQKIPLDIEVKPLNLINKIRALTTNNYKEGAYFEKDGEKYYLQIQIIKE